MCGFVAVIGRRGLIQQKAELERATNKLVHRGPDAFGLVIDREVGLGFRRLSILDLSPDSHQPFEDLDGRYVLVFNGEIYNYLELREELIGKGHVFRSRGDTEVLLASYKEWGTECLARFNGMWAFVIFDRKARTLFGSRDRFGIKPLFVCDSGGRRIFASEIKAITAMDGIHRAFNWRIASQYLVAGRLSEPDARWETMYDGIMEVPAGHAFVAERNGGFRTWPYWSLPEARSATDEDPSDCFAEILQNSVRLRLRSDVPVGVCLSGGLDSTAIICHMSKALGPNRTKPLHAFTYFDERFDETEEVEATIRETNAELHSLTSSAMSFLDKLSEVIEFHDEPLHSLNVLVSYQLYAMAAAHGIRVILNGQGADETWAGYPSYFHNYWYALLLAGKIGRARKEIEAFADTHGSDAASLWRQTLRTAFRSQLRRAKIYRVFAARRALNSINGDDWFTPDFLGKYRVETPEFESLDLDTALRKSVNREPLPLYLRVEDRNSMAHSIETRLPFMDYRLVSLAFRTKDQWKLRGGLNKFTLRQATRGVIPEIVRTRIDKMGFPVSAREWFAGPLYDSMREILSSESARQNGIIAPAAILRDLELHRQGKADFSEKLLRVMQFELIGSTTSV